MFAEHGKVADAVVMMEPSDPDRSKGFGFVTMTNKLEAEKAIKAINGREVLGREIVCNIAKPREPRFRF
jgi:RNA recognition motif-containing protein